MSNLKDSLQALDQRRADWAVSLRNRWQGQPRWSRALLFILLAAGLALLPVVEPPIITTVGTDFTGVLFLVGVYCLCALGLNIVVGLAGLLDLGYVGFFAVGAYAMAVLGSPQSAAGTNWPFLLCIPAAIAVSMVAGLILGAPTLRLRGDYLAIVTLGFGEIVRLSAVNSDALGAAAGIRGVPRPPGERGDGTKLFSLVDVTPFYWLTLAVIFAVIWVISNLERSRVGRAWLAIREDEDAAELMGVPTFRFKLWAFAMGAAVGGLSGALFASRQTFINPESFPVLTSMLFLAAVVIGGAGNKLGVIVGAIIVAYLPERLRSVDTELLSAWYTALALGVLIYLALHHQKVGAALARLRDPSRPVRRSARLTVIGVVGLIALFAVLPLYLRSLGDDIAQLRFLMFGLGLLAMSVFRPEGILPSRRRATELADRQEEVAPGVA